MKTYSSLLFLLPTLLALAFVTFTADASKPDVASWRPYAVWRPYADSQSSVVQPRQRTNNYSRLLAAKTDDEAAAGDDDAKGDDLSSGDDDSYYKESKRLLPPETDQPSIWPAIVLIIFLVMAVGSLINTCCKNCRKRREYQSVPVDHLIV